MNKIKHEQGIETDRDHLHRRRMRELAFNLIELDMSKANVRAKFKEYLCRRCSWEADVLIKEIDQRVAACTRDETEADREDFEEKKVRALVSSLVELRIDTQRRWEVVQSF